MDGMNVGLTVNLQQSVSYVDQDKPGRAGSLSFDVLRKLFDYGFMRLLNWEGTAQPSWPSGRCGLPMIHHLEAHWQLK
jgi:hypothetical protein